MAITPAGRLIGPVPPDEICACQALWHNCLLCPFHLGSEYSRTDARVMQLFVSHVILLISVTVIQTLKPKNIAKIKKLIFRVCGTVAGQRLGLRLVQLPLFCG